MNRFIAFLLIVAVVFSGCGNAVHKIAESTGQEMSEENENVRYELQWAGWTLSQFISESSCVFLGECKEMIPSETGGAGKLYFDIRTVYKGAFDSNVDGFTALNPEIFIEDKDYLIFCGLDASVYSGTDHYGISAVVFDTDQGLYHEGIFDIEQENLASVCAFVDGFVKENASDNKVSVNNDYCRSDDLKDVFNYASDVLIVQITGIMDNSLSDRTSYFFDTKERLKGDADGEQWIIAFKDSMEIGREYVVLAKKPEKDSVFFVMCSPHSVLGIESKEAEIIVDFASVSCTDDR